jgi:hypothetical protein
MRNRQGSNFRSKPLANSSWSDKTEWVSFSWSFHITCDEGGGRGLIRHLTSGESQPWRGKRRRGDDGDDGEVKVVHGHCEAERERGCEIQT